MAPKPSKRDLLSRVRAETSDTDTGRRRVLQGGLASAVLGAVGLGSLTGSAAAADGDEGFGVVREQARPADLDGLDPLLARLADDGLLADATPDALTHEPLANSREGSAVLDVDGGRVHTFVTRTDDGGKLTINVPAAGDAYAIYALDGAGPGKRIRYDLIGETVETTEMTYTTDRSGLAPQAGDGCGQYCGGSTCSPAGNCIGTPITPGKRYCVESCRTDDAGNDYCYDGCSCGCP